MATSEYYRSALGFAESTQCQIEFKDYSFPPTVVQLLRIKSIYYRAYSQYRASIDDVKADRYGDEITRLQLARDALKEIGSGIVEVGLKREISILKTATESNLARALRDNTLIYHKDPTLLSSLGIIKPASMVHPTAPETILETH